MEISSNNQLTACCRSCCKILLKQKLCWAVVSISFGRSYFFKKRECSRAVFIYLCQLGILEAMSLLNLLVGHRCSFISLLVKRLIIFSLVTFATRICALRSDLMLNKVSFSLLCCIISDVGLFKQIMRTQYFVMIGRLPSHR